MSDGIKRRWNHRQRRRHSGNHPRSAQGERHRSGGEPPLEPGSHGLSRRSRLADRHHHRRGRSIFLARLGSEGGSRRRGIRLGLGRRRIRRIQLSEKSQQAHHRGRQRHRLRRRFRSRARHRHHRDGRTCEICPARDQRRRAGRCRNHQIAAANSLSRRGGVLAHGTLDGCRRGQALGAGQPRRAQGPGHDQGARNRAASWWRDRRCCFPRSNSCCVTPKWCPSTRPSNCTTRWTPCSGSFARTI